MSLNQVFEEALRGRRQREHTLTSSFTNVHYYGAPVYAKKRDIWPPLASELGTAPAADVDSQAIADTLFAAWDGPLGIHPSSARTNHSWRLYEPLCEGSFIRLVELYPGQHDDALSISLHCIDLQADQVQYEALSYVWGRSSLGREGSKSDISVDGHRLRVPTNLEQALRHLRLLNKSRLLWADSICIDQSNAKERGHQVTLMSKIYRHSTRVVIWLGEVAEWVNEAEPAEVIDVCAEHGYGAVCEVVNGWLEAMSITKRASYRIFPRRPTTATNENFPESSSLSGFELECPTLRESLPIKRYYSEPEDEFRLYRKGTLPEPVELYLRRKLGTHQASRKDTSHGSIAIDGHMNDPRLSATIETAQDSAFWYAILTFFSSPWFWRLWVFQEVVLPPDAVVRWGRCEMNWRFVGLAAAILRTNYHAICESMKIGGVYNAYLMFRASAMSDLPPVKLDFLQLLQLTRQFEVSEPRDRVFGLLGIKTTDNDPQQEDTFVNPDYEIDLMEVWKRVAIKIVTQSRKLTPLSSVQYTTDQLESEGERPSYNVFGLKEPNSAEKLPSWVPQWDNVYRASLLPWDAEERFFASEGLHTVAPKIVDDQLLVPGVEIGTVVYTFRYMWHEIDLSILWSHHLHPFFQTEGGLRLLASTLTAGRNPYGSIVSQGSSAVSDLAAYILNPVKKPAKGWNSRLRQANSDEMVQELVEFVKSIDAAPQLERLHRLAVGGSAARFLETALVFCERRRLFITATGFLGLGSDTVAEGDTLVVLAGGDLPFVLRYAERDTDPDDMVDVIDARGEAMRLGNYLLVGDSYVPGLMNGEIKDLLAGRGIIEGPIKPEGVIQVVIAKSERHTVQMRQSLANSGGAGANAIDQMTREELFKMTQRSARLEEFNIR